MPRHIALSAIDSLYRLARQLYKVIGLIMISGFSRAAHKANKPFGAVITKAQRLFSIIFAQSRHVSPSSRYISKSTFRYLIYYTGAEYSGND